MGQLATPLLASPPSELEDVRHLGSGSKAWIPKVCKTVAPYISGHAGLRSSAVPSRLNDTKTKALWARFKGFGSLVCACMRHLSLGSGLVSGRRAWLDGVV